MNRDIKYFYLPSLFIVSAAFFLQTLLFFSPDVGFLLLAANRMLAGGTYVGHFFETNPPMILYLYSPICLISHITPISIITIARIYIFLLATLSIYLSVFLIKKIIRPQDKILIYAFFYTMMFILFFVPMFEFGQREHFLIILMLPYLFSSACALEEKRVSPLIACTAGLMAGLGFGLKPFFLLTPVLIELYLIVKKRRLSACLRIESVMILSVLCIYLYSVLHFHPDYIKIILPFVMRFYFIGARETMQILFLKPYVIFCLITLSSYIWFYRYDRYRQLSMVMLLALIGMIFAFLLPRSAWFYHVMPALGLACLLLALFFGQSIVSCVNKKSDTLVRDMFILSCAGILIFFPPLTYNYKMLQYGLLKNRPDSLNKLITYIDSQPGSHSIFCFASASSGSCFPLVYDTHSEYGTRFPFFWWYRGLMRLKEEHAKEKKYLFDAVADDLNRYKSRLVIINTDDSRFMPLFLENKQFQKAWKQYSYRAQIGSYQIYERLSGGTT